MGDPPIAGPRLAPPAGWYPDPWREAPWRWWDGSSWTGLTTTPLPSELPGPPLARPDARPDAPAPAAPVVGPQRRRLVAELCLVLAIFPLPYAIAAVVALLAAALGKGAGDRTPVLIGGHAAVSFPFELLEILLPFAAVGLVAYLLSVPGSVEAPSGEARAGGLKVIGLDRTNLRGDLALLLVVFLFCELIPIYGGAAVLSSLGVHGIVPKATAGPHYYIALDVVDGFTSGIVEEIVVLGYLVRRLEQLRLPGWAVVLVAVAVRGSYHLYYGWGVLPILVWAAVTVVLYRRYRRLLPFIIVHVLWDTSIFLAATFPTTRQGGIFLGAEALVLIPLSLLLFVLWRNHIPRPHPARA